MSAGGPITRKTDPNEPRTWFLLHVGARLIGYADVIDNGDELWLAELGVHPRYRGHGMAAFILLTVIRDHPGRQIALSAQAFTPDVEDWPWEKGLSTPLLAAWYARHGFQPDPDEDSAHRMVRRP